MEVVEISEHEAQVRLVKRSISEGLRQGLYIPAAQRNLFAQIAVRELLREGVAVRRTDSHGEHIVRGGAS